MGTEAVPVLTVPVSGSAALQHRWPPYTGWQLSGKLRPPLLTMLAVTQCQQSLSPSCLRVWGV